MKKHFYLFFLTLLISIAGYSQSWTVYDANTTPDLATPAFATSNGTEGTWTVEDDTEISGNKFLVHESLGTGNGMYKTADFDPIPTKFTTAFRVKSKDAAATGVFEMDLHINGIRDQLIVYSNNSLKLTRSGATVDLTGTLDVTKWNIFRVTIDASAGTQGDVKVYLNEDVTPVLTATTTTATTAKYWRFGDGQGSVTYSAYIDFILSDASGAYAPSESAIPSELLPKETPATTWTVYDGSLSPDLATPAWAVSNATNSADVTWVVQDDAEVAGNKVLAFSSPTAGQSGMWRTAAFETPPTKFTYVTRFKQNSNALERIMDVDIDLGGRRETFNIKSDNTIGFQRATGSVDLNGTLDVTKWNVLRISFDASSGTDVVIKLYLNESNDPVHTYTSTFAGSNSYMRYGDGNGTPTYSALFDFVAYDITGAFSPTEAPLPEGLIPEVVVEEPGEDEAYLSALTIDGTTVSGFAGNKFEYAVELAYGTTTVPTVAATALYETSTAVVTQATALPGSASVLVTGKGSTTQTYSINFTVAKNNDATLSAVTVNGVAVSDFSPADFKYRVPIEYGSTTIPVVVVTTNDPNASYVLTDATEVLGTAKVEVTAENGAAKNTYEFTFYYEISSDASLSDLKVDGATISGFDPDVLTYDMEVTTLQAPGVIPTTSHVRAIAFVTYPASLPGAAVVKVTAEDGSVLRYTINFTTSAVITGMELEKMKFYPNPVVDQLTIDKAENISSITVFNVNGQRVASLTNTHLNNTLSMNFTELKSGIYLLNVKYTDGTVGQVKIKK